MSSYVRIRAGSVDTSEIRAEFCKNSDVSYNESCSLDVVIHNLFSLNWNNSAAFFFAALGTIVFCMLLAAFVQFLKA